MPNAPGMRSRKASMTASQRLSGSASRSTTMRGRASSVTVTISWCGGPWPSPPPAPPAVGDSAPALAARHVRGTRGQSRLPFMPNTADCTDSGNYNADPQNALFRMIGSYRRHAVLLLWQGRRIRTLLCRGSGHSAVNSPHNIPRSAPGTVPKLRLQPHWTVARQVKCGSFGGVGQGMRLSVPYTAFFFT